MAVFSYYYAINFSNVLRMRCYMQATDVNNYEVINKSKLIDELSSINDNISEAVVDEAVRELIELMVNAISNDGRVEIRGFGSFCLHHHKARAARNPKTGEGVEIGAKAVPHFKAGKTLRELVDYE